MNANGNGYKLLGLLVWRGGKWYLRRRLPSTRAIVISAAGGLGVVVVGSILMRRSGG